ncbi:hypothetical protein PMAYCL1PPCAC_04381 [Pristionchus mayeri]|uniref:Uncharacterized protein n=1 Tax=Pristionchus mayeri TaxID=1317129 RepID=A0AAN4Z520_9BILA|nr:hypothetical protein PMAYCL1PPCAC_04381 [Pristionchus mayeri]
MMGDNVYTHDEINRALGADSPLVPAGADSDDFHQLMRKRAVTAAVLTGRSYRRSRHTEGPRYEPPRLPDMGLYRAFQDPTVVLAAIGGDLEPIRRAIADIPAHHARRDEAGQSMCAHDGPIPPSLPRLPRRTRARRRLARTRGRVHDGRSAGGADG